LRVCKENNFAKHDVSIKLADSLWKAKQIIKEFKPDVVIGTGGFASGPLLKMASMMEIPTVIQEQNSYPGITNKLLSKKNRCNLCGMKI
jgi:UDP-N-acetylglucosamine--N-acetylmuramyl-(pentapeptide) pyrophosphoryl-undecaprenol N-acetylglucosamine transferase